MAKKPKTVRIGGTDYVVTVIDRLQDEDGKSVYGLYCLAASTIELDKDQAPTPMFQSKWHEVVHGILVHAGIPAADHDETLVDAIANGVCQVLRDNPHMRDVDAFGEFLC